MKLYFKYLSVNLKSQMQHKSSFLLLTVGQFLTSFSAFIGIYFLMSRFNTVKGFTLSEVLLCFSAVLMAFSLAECFARGFDTFSSTISNGEFDRILTRPKNPVFQVLASKTELTKIGRLLQAVLTLIIAVTTGNFGWNFKKIAVLILMIICGAVFFSAMFTLGAAVCFYTTEGLEVINILTDGGREFGRYPLSVYGKNALRLYTFVIPMALFQYYPLLYITGKTQSALYALSPIASLAVLIPVAALWSIGLKHYKSTGS